MRSRELLELLGEVARIPVHELRAVLAGFGMPQMIGRQFERILIAREALEKVLEATRYVRLTLPTREVAILGREGRQLRRAARAKSLIAFHELAQEHSLH